MKGNKSELTVLIEYPPLELNEWKKLVIRKVMKGNIPCLDVRLHQRYPFSEGYNRTSKGIFLDETMWLEKVIPYMNTLTNQYESSNKVT